MLSNPLFSGNPWHSWRSPRQVENIQTLSEDNLFDDDMTSISDSGDRIDGAAPAQSQLDTLPPIANASLDAPTPVARAQPDASASVTRVQPDASASVARAQPDASASVAHVQPDASTSVTHAQPEAPTSVTPSDPMIDAAGQHKVLQPEHDNVWWTPEPEYIPNVDTSRPAEPETPMDLGETAPSTSKRPTDSHLAPANKKPVLAVASDKCRHDEVDYSLSLRKELYAKEGELSAKEDLIDRLRMKLRKKNVQVNQEFQEALRRYYGELLDQAVQAMRQDSHNEKQALEQLLTQRNNELNSLRGVLESQSQEHAKAQEAATQRYTAQLDGFRHQLELSMRTEVDRLQANRTAEMEGRIQEEITRLKESLQAEKERELANIEQRHSRSRKPALPTSLEDDVDMELPELAARAREGQPKQTAGSSTLRMSMQQSPRYSTLPRTPAQPSSSPTRPQPRTSLTTPNIDAIKRIRRGRGTSKRTRLVGVLIDDDNDNGTGRPSGPELRPDNISVTEDDDDDTRNPIMSTSESVMENAIAEGLATALRNILPKISGTLQPFPNRRRTPHRKRKEDREVALEKATEPSHHRDFILAEVRRLFKARLYITQDVDFITHKPASVHDVHAYEHEDGPTPDENTIAFDLSQNYASPWNAFLLELLLQELQSRCREENWPIKKSDNYIREILRDRYKRLRTIWRNAQPKVAATGHLETPGEVEARLINERTQAGKESRQATRRRNKYERRKLILDHIAALKSDTYDDDLPSWQWLGRLIKTLGEHGMSSEESAVENGVENVLRVKTMSWRRNIDRELEIVDLQRTVDIDIFSPQGSRPLRRIHATENPTTKRDAVKGLPLALYDGAWIAGLTECQKESLEISTAPFPWMKVAVV
ncbi:hypothetical protein EDC04DRAFT_2911880 [Pisolithus marmoratus]|nr:hypothetical protein EDC04DRAFT_2911880 [Pisolithus marmoratus]